MNAFRPNKLGAAAGRLVLLLALIITAAGCASLGGGEPLGTLTITGVPAEYEGGQFQALSGVRSIKVNTGRVANGQAAIPVQQPVSGDGVYALSYNIVTEGRPNAGIQFEAVRFENGAATLKWDEGIRAGSFTITNIPEETEFNGGVVAVNIGPNPSWTRDLQGNETGFQGNTGGFPNPDVCSSSLWVQLTEGSGLTEKIVGFKPYTASGAKDVIVKFTFSANAGGFEFSAKSVQFTDGSAAIDFADYCEVERQKDGKLKVTLLK